MTEIDQDLYSRQIYVLGNQAMVKLTEAKILLHGLGSLGLEIAKNIVLAGIGSLTILEDKQCDMIDLGSQFYVQKDDVDKKFNRGFACLDQLKKLNPYVKIELVETNLASFESNDDLLEYLKKFNTVILTEVNDLALSIRVNTVCRENGIKFLASDVFGLFAYSFTDFGPRFDVMDADGEDYKSVFISSILINDKKDTSDSAEANEALIETIDQKPHNLEVNDMIRLSEIKNDQVENDSVINALNENAFKVTRVLNSHTFQIELNASIVDSSAAKIYNLKCGLFKKVKKVEHVEFNSLSYEITKPSLLFSDLTENKFFNPYFAHISSTARQALPVNTTFEEFKAKVVENLEHFKAELTITNLAQILNKLTRVFYFSSRGRCFPPLAAIYGGIVGQEVLKSITNKFLPVKQWLYLDCSELFELDSFNAPIIEWSGIYESSVLRRNDRYDCLRLCFGGEKTLEKLFRTKLFMVGCGAIGCEMLKNYALLGIACDPSKSGLITITDNDLIEKSNLNRQFLFRQHDIQQFKSKTAAKAILAHINPDVRIEAHEHKVCSQTEQTVFTDGFFKRQDFCVNALDNVDARRYMDTRCVSTQKPLLESGTLAAKGHVQVIVPHLTESYNSQKDPNDADAEIPYCTLKSFPANIDHCIQWSRDKFESLFKIKPLSLAKFFEEFETREKLDALIVAVVAEQPGVEKHYKLIKYLSTNFCFTWSDCLVLARAKFEKYFTNKAKDLLNAYPLDHLMNDGSLFWKLPKRPPMPVKFDYENRVHLEFVASLARLFAVLFNVARDNANDFELIKNVLRDNESRVPSWKPRKKHIEVDETKKKEDVQQDDQATDTDNKEVTAAEYGEKLQTFLNRYLTASGFKVDSIDFEKDDDTNGHIDFISAASNLRAAMYSIEQSDKMMVKRIAGKIVPAIATTTSSIAGFVSVELVKLVQSEVGSAQLETFRNVFLNLGISLFLLSEPGPCAKVKVTKDLYVTLWDRWVVNGNENFMLKNFIDEIKQKFRLTVSGVMYGSKSIYLPVMPGHAKRLNEKMLKLVKGATSVQALQQTNAESYVDLFMTYEECDNDTENRDRNNVCPPIRYYFY